MSGKFGARRVWDCRWSVGRRDRDGGAGETLDFFY